MKIDKITLNNITSFEGEHVIDFNAEPLRSAGLFAITGDTGAGKSTLLDAISLALYDRAPRLDETERVTTASLDNTEADSEAKALQAGDPRNLVRRGQKTASCQVEFTLADGARYEATWQCRIKRTGNYDNTSRSLRQLAPKKRTLAEGSSREVQPHINEIVGLDYAQFSRTVMLAQGSFATFLQAKKKDKSALLEKLTGTEIYGKISMKIHELAAAADNEAREKEQLIEGILHSRLSPEELEDLQTDIHQKQTLRNSLQEESETLKKQLRWTDDYEAAVADNSRLEQLSRKADRALEALRTQQIELERYDSVQPMLSLVREITLRRATLEELKQQESAATTALSLAQRKQQEAENAFNVSREQTQDAQQQLTIRQPIINRGHVLTGEMKISDEQLRTIQERMLQAQARLEERRKKLTAKQQEWTELERTVKELELHKQALGVHRVMFDNILVIRDKLNSFRSESSQNSQDHQQLTTLQRRQEEIHVALQKEEQEQQIKTDKLASLKGELLIHRQNNQRHDGSRLQQEAAEYRTRLQSLKHAQALWNNITQGYEYIDEQRAKIARDSVNIEQQHKDIRRAEQELEMRREVHQHLNEAFMLSNSENIRRLRKNLKEGTACPVCGATHHPYHTETERELGELMDNLEKDYTEANELLNQKQRQLDDMHRRLAADEGTMQADKEHLRQMEQRQAEDEREWQDFAQLDNSFADCSPTVNRDARRTMLALLIDSTKKSAEETARELEAFNFHQERINFFTEQIEQLTAHLAESKERLDNMRTDQKIIQSQTETLQQRINRSDRSCELLYRELDEMITLSEWFAEWRRSPDNLKRRLDELTQDWTGTNSALDQRQRNLTLMREELRTLEDNEEEAVRYVNTTRDERDAANERLNAKREELRRLFGELTPEAEEERLKTYINRMEEAMQKARKNFEEATAVLNSLRGQCENLQQNRQSNSNLLMEAGRKLDTELGRYNAHHSPMQPRELEDIFADPRDWNSLRAEIDQRKKDCTLAAHQFDEAQKALVKLQVSGGYIAPEAIATHRTELQARLAAVSTQLEQTSAHLLSLQTTLQAHHGSLKQAGLHQHELEQAQQNALEWRRLDTLIGSADGKKFREIAQSYTFNYLVHHANSHLRQLSPRYELRNIPGTLLLEIIDRDMFDQRRYVSSLSGGETFVVSLALALGLATLSSGSLTIGSLFIDEGFGNLDHESLDLVMNALSSLETQQGRRVGVISHTDQIRQQISPQIKVCKQPTGGRSTICIR